MTFSSSVTFPLATLTIPGTTPTCKLARERWTQATSRKAEGKEGYDIKHARDADAFPPTKWPAQLLEDLIGITFAGTLDRN